MDGKTKTPKAENEKDRNAELSDGDLDTVSGGDHGGGGRRISDIMDRYRRDPVSGELVPR